MTLRFLRLALVGAALALPAAADQPVPIPDAIAEHAAAMQPGETYGLPGGHLGEVVLSGLRGTESAPILLRAAISGLPPRFTALVLEDSRHVMLEGMDFVAGAGPALTIRNSDAIVLRALHLSDGGQANATGLAAEAVRDLVIEDSSTEGLATALRLEGVSGAILRRNRLSGATGTALSIEGGGWIAVENNRIAPGGTGDGPAMAVRGASDVSIKQNHVEGAPGRPAAIHLGAGGETGPDAALVEGNVLIGAAPEAIRIRSGADAMVVGNVLLATAEATPEAADAPRVIVDPGVEADVLGTVARAAATAVPERRPMFAGAARRAMPDPLAGVVAPQDTSARLFDDGRRAVADTMRLRMRFDGTTGHASRFDHAGLATERMALTDGVARTGRGYGAVEIPREMVGSFFSSTRFEIRAKIRAVPGRGSRGEIIRIHKSLDVEITDAGHLRATFQSADGEQVRVRSRHGHLLDGDWHEIVVGYDSHAQSFYVEADGANRGTVRAFGPTRALEYWGLAMGNPFGDRESFDGEVAWLDLHSVGGS